MISKKIAKAFNEQINEEYYSSYLYLSMMAHSQSINLDGFAHWMNLQVAEENLHAMKFINFVIERGGKVELEGIKKPPSSWKTPLKMFEDTLTHERHISERINDLVALSEKENDRASQAFLQWFVTEQVEEEA